MNLDFSFSSIETIPTINAKAAFLQDSSKVFREDEDTVPTVIDDKTSYIPWGDDNELPYHVLDLIEKDETLNTCQQFNAEVCYGSGLRYEATGATSSEAEDFLLYNPLSSLFLGHCIDFKHFGFCVTVLLLNPDGDKIVSICRKEAMYIRKAPAEANGHSPYILYANWRKPVSSKDECERILLLDMNNPLLDLMVRMGKRAGTDGKKKVRTSCRKFAVISSIPTVDSTYYPIPHYGSLFRGHWYNIKQLIGLAKESSLKNSSPIKYHIEISSKYWESIFRREHITDRKKQEEKVIEEKGKIIDFLTGLENSGKVWFSTFYVNPDGEQQSEVKINKISTDKEGGDWQSDLVEAVNMICFTMRVHTNLVGSVPGKAQTNNSGSDKRELYTIAQSLQKPYHDILLSVHRLIIAFNGWKGYEPVVPFIQLTTLDEHTDAKQVSL